MLDLENQTPRNLSIIDREETLIVESLKIMTQKKKGFTTTIYENKFDKHLEKNINLFEIIILHKKLIEEEKIYIKGRNSKH